MLTSDFLCRTMNALDQVLHLSETFGLLVEEPGALLVLYAFSIVWQLVDAALDDEGLLQLPGSEPKWPVKPPDTELVHIKYEDKRKEYSEGLQNVNTTVAIQLIAQFLRNKVTSRILYLARENMSALQSCVLYFN